MQKISPLSWNCPNDPRRGPKWAQCPTVPLRGDVFYGWSLILFQSSWFFPSHYLLLSNLYTFLKKGTVFKKILFELRIFIKSFRFGCKYKNIDSNFNWSFELPCKSSLEYKPQSKVIYEFKIFWNMLWQSMQFKRNVTRFHQSVESELK